MIHPKVALVLDLLEEGDLIWFTYIQQSGNGRWYRWEATGVFLSASQGGRGRYPNEMTISFRPKSGTSSFDSDLLLAVQVEASLSQRRQDGQIREDTRVKLPSRFRGAVNPPAHR